VVLTATATAPGKSSWPLESLETTEFALPYLREAMDLRLSIAAVCKWYRRRAIHCLQTLLPEADTTYAITFKPAYSGVPTTRENWIGHPDGKRRVIREWQEVPRRVADGNFKELNRASGAWR
jgi:hypothetical protein